MTQRTTDEQTISQTRKWIDSVIVALNFCPFARRELDRDSVRFRVIRKNSLEHYLLALMDECVLLDRDPDIETSLLILPQDFASFDTFLDLLEIANALLVEQGYKGIYQLASFHPEYRFADAPAGDPANFTNRSPFPLLHLIRESSIERAVASYPQPELIPERNMALAREKGSVEMQALLATCCKDNGKR